jgi:hypothetical protein
VALAFSRTTIEPAVEQGSRRRSRRQKGWSGLTALLGKLRQRDIQVERGPCLLAASIVVLDSAILTDDAHFARARREVSSNFLRDLIVRVGGRNDLYADFRSARKWCRVSVRVKKLRRCPRYIWDSDADLGEDRALCYRFPVRKLRCERGGEARLQSPVQIARWAHLDLPPRI